MRVLVLGGTTEARQVVELLAERPGCDVVMSLAGHTLRPAPLPCPVRTGGFGGASGLVDHLRITGTDALIDATHPFSVTMAANAAAAAALVSLPTVRVVRPAWESEPGDEWIDVPDLAEASRCLAALGARRVLLTTGRLDLEPFASLAGVQLVIRSVEPPDHLPLANATFIQQRGPFTAEAEVALLLEHGIDAMVTKNSGGSNAKLVAARRAEVRVVMVRRPPVGNGTTVATAQDAVAWLEGLGYQSSATST